MWSDPEVEMVLMSQGGETANHLLDGIDYELIERTPKIFAGISDGTTLLGRIAARNLKGRSWAVELRRAMRRRGRVLAASIGGVVASRGGGEPAEGPMPELGTAVSRRRGAADEFVMRHDGASALKSAAVPGRRHARGVCRAVGLRAAPGESS